MTDERQARPLSSEIPSHRDEEQTEPEEFEMLPERRNETRHPVARLAELLPRAGASAVIAAALVENVSTTGALLMTRLELQPGGVIRMRLYRAPRRGEPLELVAHVVRVQRRPRQVAELWTFEVALRFDAPLLDVASLTAAL